MTKLIKKIRDAWTKFCNADVFPTLHEIRETKLKCYQENYTISEASGSFKVQQFSDHTASRILEPTDFEVFFFGIP